jgi:hypothetical protein
MESFAGSSGGIVLPAVDDIGWGCSIALGESTGLIGEAEPISVGSDR